MSEKPTARPVSKPYLIFSTVFALAAVAAVVFLLKSGLSRERFTPAYNPFYTENVNYPPLGAEKVGLAALIAVLALYFPLDCLWGCRLGGWKKALFIGGWIVSVILVMEISMGAFIKNNPPLHRPHPSFLWEVYPGRKGKTRVGEGVRYLEVNRFGFRGNPVEEQKTPGTVRIMILGDSSAFGYGLNQDQAFAPLMEDILNRDSQGKKFEVINASVMGYTTFSSLNFFREKGIKFNPDLLIIAHNNDPNPDWDEDKNRAAPENLRPLMENLYRSNVYMTIRRFILNRKYGKNPETFKPAPVDMGKRRVSKDDFRANLKGLFDLAGSRGIKVMVISMPIMEDEDPATLRYREIMEKTARDNNGLFLDLFHKWQDDEHEKLFMDDVHPNAGGHKKIAEEAARVIWSFFKQPRG